ncbi:MAG: recombinase family protein [Bacteroidia bacterium]
MKHSRKVVAAAGDGLNEITIFDQFAKGKKAVLGLTNNCIIYTRVSSKEQEQGYSLDIQLKDCQEHARKQGYNILGCFGGTYESAKTDERKEFNRMLQFVKRSKDKITYIIVHMVDRFSRSGANAIYIKEQLKGVGIYIMSVKQPVDTTTTSGDFQQNMQIMFSHYDNQLRREKCMSGVKEALSRGEWCHAAPMGYDAIQVNGERKIVVNADGKLIRKAFHWKADEGVNNEECRARLAKLGIRLSHQRMSAIFKNPFYCGLMAHSMLEGKLLEGNHESMISKELFLKVNQIQNLNSHGYKQTPDQINIPMKVFLKCGNCGQNLTGYVVKKKNIWYYKCRKKGCCTNKSARDMHERFQGILSHFTLNPKYRALVKEQMVNTVKHANLENEVTLALLRGNYQEISHKMDRLEERYMNEEITQDLFVKYGAKFKEERLKISEELRKREAFSSNYEEDADLILDYAGNISKMWASAGYREKQRLQYFVFPKGLGYFKQNDGVRTEEFNSLFVSIALLQQDTGGNKCGIPELGLKYAALVDIACASSNYFAEELIRTFETIAGTKNKLL